MSVIKVNKIENTSTADGGVAIDVDGHVTIDGQQLPTAGPLSNRNLIINGAMRVAQRGTSATSGGYATVDRMDVQLSQGSSGQSQETLATSELPFTEDGHSHFLRVTNTTGSTAGGAFRGPSTILEAQDIASSGWNYKSASSFITLSFWVRASVSQEFYASLATFDGTGQNYVFSFTPAANTWTKVTKTIPGNSNLQFDSDNGPGLKISISAFWGTNWTDPSVTTDSWQTFTSSTRFPDFATTWASTNGATFDLTGVQLEVGSKATPFEHRSYGDELARCQRYFYRVADGGSQTLGLGVNYTSSKMHCAVPFPVTMRQAPTLDAASGASYYEFIRNGGADYFNSLTLDNRTTKNIGELYNDTEISGTSGHGGFVRTDNAAVYVDFSAEL